jgi:hypothetical protein
MASKTKIDIAAAVRDIAGLCGAALIAFGAWRVYEPAGFIVGGAILLAGVWLHVRAERIAEQVAHDRRVNGQG